MKKFPHSDLLPIIFIIFVLTLITINLSTVVTGFFLFLNIISSFIWAIGFALVLNPLLKLFQKKLKISRGFGILLTFVTVIIFLAVFFMIVVPSVLESIGDLINRLPHYANNLNNLVIMLIERFDLPGHIFSVESITYNLNRYVNISANSIASYITNFINSIANFGYGLFKIVFGLLISAYILKSKEAIYSALDKAFTGLFGKESSKFLLSLITEAKFVFTEFVVGKFIDSLLIGIICFLGLSILNFRYASLISLIVGITNMIPYFGPFIGMIPAVLFTIVYSPIKAIWILVYIFLLQQFDGLYLGPKILGDKVGVTPLLVILGITVGGGVGGVLGMFLGVPIMALLKTYFDRYIDYKYKKRESSSSF